MSAEQSLDELVAAARERPPQPPAAARDEGWLRLQQSLAVGAVPAFDVGPGSVAGAGAGAAKAGIATKWIMVAVLGTSATTAAVVRATSDREPAARESGASSQPMPVREQPQVAAVVAEPVAPAPAAAAPVVAPPPVQVSTAPRPRASERAPSRVAPKPMPVPRPAATLDAELSVIRSAQRALAEGDPQLALDRLAVHARVYPNGSMKEDRAALRVLALCRSGRVTEGRAEQQGFLQRFPQSMHAARVRGACGEAK